MSGVTVVDGKGHLLGRATTKRTGAGVTAYHFNQVYDGRASQRDVYLQSCRPALHSALNGLNSTVLCYGHAFPLERLHNAGKYDEDLLDAGVGVGSAVAPKQNGRAFFHTPPAVAHLATKMPASSECNFGVAYSIS
jgi:hypothetical protein